MFKRITQIKNAVEKVKTAKDILKEEIDKNAESQESPGTIKIIHQVAGQIFQKVSIEGKQMSQSLF